MSPTVPPSAPGQPDLLEIASDRLSAAISPHGAELRRLRDGDGNDLLWDGDPAWWTGRAPILFPAIGFSAGGGYTLDGHRYPMTKHGFARDRTFAVERQAEDSVTLRLAGDDATRAMWPFAFTLDLTYAIAGATLTMTAEVANLADTTMPASFGFHPAFRWPLPYGGPREQHRIRFDRPEPDPIRRIGADGLLLPDPEPTPVEGDVLTPRDAMFEADALILDRVRSHGLLYGAPGAPGLRIETSNLPVLAFWTKPGAPYLCIEPWAGLPDPADFDGDLADKPGVVPVAAGDSVRFVMAVTLDDGPE